MFILKIVVEFKKKENVPEVFDKNLFFKLIRDSFFFFFKTLRNNLKGYDLRVIEQTLNKFGYDLSIRAEQLSLEVFVTISNSLSSK